MNAFEKVRRRLALPCLLLGGLWLGGGCQSDATGNRTGRWFPDRAGSQWENPGQRSWLSSDPDTFHDQPKSRSRQTPMFRP